MPFVHGRSLLSTLLFALPFLVLSSSCSHRPKIQEKEVSTSPVGQIAKSEWLHVSTHSYKSQIHKYDIKIQVGNSSDKDLIIMHSDIRCFKGPKPGKLTFTPSKSTDGSIALKAGASHNLKLVCRHGIKREGLPRLVISRIYENPNGDGKLRGRVIAENIEWKYGS